MSRWRDIKQGNIQNKQEEKLDNTRFSSSASIGSRLKAFLTDSFLITTPITYIIMYLVLGGGDGFAQHRTFGWGLILGISAFFIVLFWYIKSQTPGMKAYELKIVNYSDKKRVSFLQALIRYVATLFAIISIFLMFIPFFNKEKRTFQDIISNSSIIKE